MRGIKAKFKIGDIVIWENNGIHISPPLIGEIIERKWNASIWMHVYKMLFRRGPAGRHQTDNTSTNSRYAGFSVFSNGFGIVSAGQKVEWNYGGGYRLLNGGSRESG